MSWYVVVDTGLNHILNRGEHVVGNMSLGDVVKNHVVAYVVETPTVVEPRRGEQGCRGTMSWTTYVVEPRRGEHRGQHMSWNHVVGTS